MAEYYKHEIAAWNEGTDNLTLEQEAAYHRVVSMIRLYERPLKHNLRVLSGMWRCNERKAKRLLAELVEAGKLRIDGDQIINDKAVNDASTLRQLRVDRGSAGRRGGIESGKVRRKSLENNDPCEASARTIKEKRREEKKREESSVSDPTTARPQVAADAAADNVRTHRENLLRAMGADPVSGLIGPNGRLLGTAVDMVEAAKWGAAPPAGLGLSEADQLAVCRDVLARSKSGPFRFAYFTQAMADLAATRAKPVPSGSPAATDLDAIFKAAGFPQQ